MTKSKPRVDVSGSPSPLKQSLSGLAALREKLPPGPSEDAAPASAAPKPPAETAYSRAGKLVVRRERKGHGGKTVTRVEGLQGNSAELEAIVKDVKRALGCGATLEDSHVLVQGDQSDRLSAFLQSRGARKVIVGN